MICMNEWMIDDKYWISINEWMDEWINKWMIWWCVCLCCVYDIIK